MFPSPTDSSVTDRVMAFGRPNPFPVDVEDRGQDFLVTADLPGLRKQKIDVRVRKDKLEIEANFGEAGQETDRRTERARGTASRVIRLPVRVDEKRVSAAYDNGVLWVTLPKRRPPKRVEVE